MDLTETHCLAKGDDRSDSPVTEPEDPMSNQPPAQHVGGEPEHRRPRWVTASLLVAVAVVVTFLAIHLAGGGMRGHS